MEADALTIEQGVLRWPSITATPDGFGATALRYGEREIGHRRDPITDLPVTPGMREELLDRGHATPHRAGAEGYVRYPVQDQEDVSKVLEILGWDYDSAREVTSQDRPEAEA